MTFNHHLFTRIFRLLCALCVTFTLLALSSRPAQAQVQPTDIVLEVNSGTVQVREAPDPNGKVYRALIAGERVSWNGTAQKVAGRNWIPVTLNGINVSSTAWITPDSNVLATIDPTQITPGIDLSATVQTARPLILYSAPALNRQAVDSRGQIITLPPNTQFQVQNGPTVAELYTWWNIKTADGLSGWITDIRGALQTITPLKVYGINVCDGFNLRGYGVAGWDSFMQGIGTAIPGGEQIVCLASSNFRSDGTPVVTVLTHTESANNRHDTVRQFVQDANGWTKLFEQPTPAFARTERLSLNDLTGDGKPTLLWLVRNDGTGQYLDVNLYQFNPAAGVQPILQVQGLYKGSVQVGKGTLLLLQPILKENEPNCCPTGFNRIAYQWQNNEFVQVLDDQPISPYLLQGAPKQ